MLDPKVYHRQTLQGTLREVENLLQGADLTLYQAKSGGRNECKI
jgi:PleD family two-component response regulator